MLSHYVILSFVNSIKYPIQRCFPLPMHYSNVPISTNSSHIMSCSQTTPLQKKFQNHSPFKNSRSIIGFLTALFNPS